MKKPRCCVPPQEIYAAVYYLLRRCSASFVSHAYIISTAIIFGRRLHYVEVDDEETVKHYLQTTQNM